MIILVSMSCFEKASNIHSSTQIQEFGPMGPMQPNGASPCGIHDSGTDEAQNGKWDFKIPTP